MQATVERAKGESLKRKVEAEQSAKASENAGKLSAQAKGDMQKSQANVRDDTDIANDRVKAEKNAKKKESSETLRLKEKLREAKDEEVVAEREAVQKSTAAMDTKLKVKKAMREEEEAEEEEAAAKTKMFKQRAKLELDEMTEAAAAHIVPEQSPLVEMACGLYATCGECTADSHCGWIPE